MSNTQRCLPWNVPYFSNLASEWGNLKRGLQGVFCNKSLALERRGRREVNIYPQVLERGGSNDRMVCKPFGGWAFAIKSSGWSHEGCYETWWQQLTRSGPEWGVRHCPHFREEHNGSCVSLTISIASHRIELKNNLISFQWWFTWLCQLDWVKAYFDGWESIISGCDCAVFPGDIRIWNSRLNKDRLSPMWASSNLLRARIDQKREEGWFLFPLELGHKYFPGLRLWSTSGSWAFGFQPQ